MAKIISQIFSELNLSPLLIAIFLYLSQITYSKESPKNKSFQLKLIHVDSRDSPMYQPELTNEDRTKRLADISNSRARYISLNTTNINSFVYDEQDVNPLTMFSHESIYFVELGLGTFGAGFHNVYLIFDTGSSWTWTQCEGCSMCFPQNTPLFQRYHSQTYNPYPCGQCPGFCNQDHCTFEETYGDGTQVRGIIATERLTFASQYYDPQSIYGFNFICATEIQHFVPGSLQGNFISGILGMGRGGGSLMFQLASQRLGQNIFSYCLQSTTNQGGFDLPSLIRFGDAVNSEDRLPGMSSTQLIHVSDKSHYYLSLNDISVAGSRLNIQPHFFAVQPDNSGGTIIDSGTAFTFLVPRAFESLLRRIDRFMAAKNPDLVQKYHGQLYGTGFEDCWAPIVDSPDVRRPKLTFHFSDNANLVMNSNEVLIIHPFPGVPNPGLYCLTVRRFPYDNAMNIIGAYHQVNQLLIYDVGNSLLSFINFDCSNRL